jgi:aldehyde:ferredoxin oxidoreductase
MAPGHHYVTQIGNPDVDLMFKLAALSDQYAIDVMNMGEVLGYVMECFEAGILTPSDLGGLQMDWGNSSAIMDLFEMVVRREGIGDILAEGVTKAAKVIGKGSEKYVMESKGMAVDSRDPRGSKAWGLGYAVSSRGADHCRHLFPDMPLVGGLTEPERMKRIFKFGGRELDRLSEKGQGEMVRFYEDEHTFRHCLEVCLFTFRRVNPDSARLLADLYNAVTGLRISPSDVVTIGERVTNLERAFSVREGLTRRDDSLPDRFLKEPMPDGPTKGQVVNLDLMLDEYDDARGWDRDSGFPTRRKLEQLGLKEVADELDSLGKLA